MLSNLLRRPEQRNTSTTTTASQFYAQMWADRFTFNGVTYVPGGLDRTLTEMATANAPLAAAMDVRVKVFSEATFKFQRFESGRPGTLFGAPSLGLLEQPWPGAGTEHLLSAMEVDHSIFGNAYWTIEERSLVRLDPTHMVTIKTDVVRDGIVVSQRLIGYGYQQNPQSKMVMFTPSDIAHFRTTPDPSDPFRGTSWMRAVSADADSDTKLTGYKSALLKNSGVPPFVLKAEPGVSLEQYNAAKEMLDSKYTGWQNAGKPLTIGAGWDVQVVGANPQQIDLKSLQGAGETRIAAAAGVPVPIVGFSEGLAGSSLNAGNYGAARRRLADGTIRPLWRAACTALSTLVPPPPGTRLWYDAADVSFLQEDEQDAASIRETNARTIRQLVDAGYDPDASTVFAQTGDANVLVGKHSGLYSVQLQPAGAQPPAP